MAFDEGLAQRVREILADRNDVREKRMFGGLAFMVAGHMACGIRDDELMVRVGKERWDESLARPHAREMDFTGRSLKGFVYVGSEGLREDDQLAHWVRWAVEHAESLPVRG